MRIRPVQSIYLFWDIHTSTICFGSGPQCLLPEVRANLTTFLLTPLIQYNKFEAIEEVRNEGCSHDVEKHTNDHLGLCLCGHLWCGPHCFQDRHPSHPWYHRSACCKHLPYGLRSVVWTGGRLGISHRQSHRRYFRRHIGTWIDSWFCGKLSSRLLTLYDVDDFRSLR